MTRQEAVDRVNEAIDHLNERIPYKNIMAPAFASAYGGCTVVIITRDTHFEISDIEIEMNSKVGLTRIVRHRLLMMLDNIRDSVHKTDSAVESKPRIFSGMSFKEIQTAADKMSHQDSGVSIYDLIILIANLAARMKEKE